MREALMNGLLIGALVLGCGSDSNEDSGANTPEGVCPSSQPAEGDACDEERSQVPCSYGDAVLPGCRTVLSCGNGTFKAIDLNYLSCPENACSGELQLGDTCDPDADAVCHESQASTCRCEECEPYTSPLTLSPADIHRTRFA